WEALVKEEGGRYVAGLPLPVRRKFGLRYLQQPLFAQELGFFYLEAPTTAEWAQLGSMLRQQFIYITKYAFNVGNAAVAGAASLGLTSAPARTYHLSLQPSYAELWASYRPERRRHLRKAQQHALIVEPTTNIDLLVQLYDENIAHRFVRVQGEAYEYRLLRALYSAAFQVGMTSLWQARSTEGEIVAMMLLLHFKQQTIYFVSCTTVVGRALGATSMLIDDFLQQHAGQVGYFDFESPGISNMERFYGSFGSVPVPFFTIVSDQMPWPVRQLKAARILLYQRFRPRLTPDSSPD
ncbi:GNAT family N-acetyltransferase, partial [Hymenobacter sp. UV11]